MLRAWGLGVAGKGGLLLPIGAQPVAARRRDGPHLMPLAAAIHAGGLSEGADLPGLAQSAVGRLPVLLAAHMAELGREPL